MFRVAKILFPVDFSPRSKRAAHYAGMLACRFRSELTLLHVMPPFDGYPIYAMEAAVGSLDPMGPLGDELTQQLDQFANDQFPRLQTTRLVLEGDPAARIVETAASGHADLIVMPTHGYGRFRRFILGSVTAKVLHDADCPVFTGTHLEEENGADAGLFQNILCAIDLGPQSQSVLKWGAAMAAELHAKLHVVHALPALEAGQARYFDQDWRIDLERSECVDLEKLVAEAGLKKANVLLNNGEVSRVVCNAAKATGADLVVIGRHAGAGIFGRLRQHAYAIVRESPCPVVSV